MLPYTGFDGACFTLMHDNVSPHAANIFQQYLREIGIPILDWPSRSPNLNPIEHLWDEFKKRVMRRKRVPETLADLQTELRGMGGNTTGNNPQAHQIRTKPSAGGHKGLWGQNPLLRIH